MTNWRLLIFISVFFFLFGSCSKRFLNLSKPTKGTYVDREYFDGKYRTINPNDTNTINKYSLTEDFRIISIKQHKGFYTIMIDSDSSIGHSFLSMSTFQIVSLKGKKIKGHEEIKIGQRYKLTINPALVPSPKNVIPSHVIVYVFTKGMWIPVESTINIYTTPNLDGLYYIPLQLTPCK
jgi:hypothetical protein